MSCPTGQLFPGVERGLSGDTNQGVSFSSAHWILSVLGVDLAHPESEGTLPGPECLGGGEELGPPEAGLPP